MKSPSPFNNIITVTFKKEPIRKMSIPDNLVDHNAATDLVKRLTKYYHSRGFKQVKVWLEPELLASGRKMFCVRSNIHFSVPQ